MIVWPGVTYHVIHNYFGSLLSNEFLTIWVVLTSFTVAHCSLLLTSDIYSTRRIAHLISNKTPINPNVTYSEVTYFQLSLIRTSPWQDVVIWMTSYKFSIFCPLSYRRKWYTTFSLTAKARNPSYLFTSNYHWACWRLLIRKRTKATLLMVHL